MALLAYLNLYRVYHLTKGIREEEKERVLEESEYLVESECLNVVSPRDVRDERLFSAGREIEEKL